MNALAHRAWSAIATNRRLAVAISILSACACGPKIEMRDQAIPDAASGLDEAIPDLQNSADLVPPTYTDFPADPIVDTSGGSMTPANSAMLFGGASSGSPTGGPCLIEPEIGALFPNNWLRLRVSWVAPQGQNLFEIRLHNDRQQNDLLVYTTATTWTMPAPMWKALLLHAPDEDVTISVRGAVYDGAKLSSGPALGTIGTVRIAPVPASGTVVYWTTSTNTALKGFAIGDESVQTVLSPPQVQMKTSSGATVTCIGCHTSTPDGLYAGFTAQGPWGNVLASIVSSSTGAQPPWLGAGAVTALGLNAPLGIETFSKAHFSAGDRIEIAPIGDHGGAQLAWFDLEAQNAGLGAAYGILARTGDTRGVGAPTWSHDGKTIVYVSSNAEYTGRLDVGDADLYAISYNDRAGGMATPIAGAATGDGEEYYPAWSGDDALLAYDRAPANTTMYSQPQAELYVIDSKGGTALRLAANDPPACSGIKSPGITNSWPKWSPDVPTFGTRSYYWLIFSSTRTLGHPQLYMSAVVVDTSEGNRTVSTYPSVYLWNQPPGESNHTPAWDVFQIAVQ